MPPRVGLRLTALVGAPAQSRPLFAITPAASVFVARCASTSTSTSRATLPAANLAVASSRRFLATHTDGPWNNQTGSQNPGGKKRESVEETLRRLESEARRVGEDREHVGPFPLGVGPSGRRKPWKSWSDLGVRGKVWRTTQQTGNLAIIFLGGGLFVILTLALTTELFANNSPSVLYSECIDMIRDSDALNRHLLPPLSYTHTPHSASPTRGTAPVVHAAVRNSVSGRDHLVLTFWVHGRGRDEPEPLHWAKRWWAQAEDYGRRGLGFLGFAIEPVEEVQAVVNPSTKDGYRSEDAGPGFLGRMVGAFSLRGPATAVRSATARLPPPGTYKLGEVHADYVKNASGQYQMLSLVIDVPSSRAPHPGRAIVFWSPEADREGVIGRR